MHENRVLLRRLLGALLAERPDSAGVYVPRGEEGMIRMIRVLLDMRPERENDPLAGEIEAFRGMGECSNRQPGQSNPSIR